MAERKPGPLTSQARDRLHDSTFAYIDSDGTGHLPLEDANHVRNAIARFSQTNFPDGKTRQAAWRKVKTAATKFGVHLAETSD